jgi:hypothetical protein
MIDKITGYLLHVHPQKTTIKFPSKAVYLTINRHKQVYYYCKTYKRQGFQINHIPLTLLTITQKNPSQSEELSHQEIFTIVNLLKIADTFNLSCDYQFI